ncbi:hypothetical protein VNO77_24226 [Canavalia gladiata]|uniref:Uncharacterized protein n=1 Tax=Canavalia gladiata TaxID=3824 RepID=A0AAN9L753_CANGL
MKAHIFMRREIETARVAHCFALQLLTPYAPNCFVCLYNHSIHFLFHHIISYHHFRFFGSVGFLSLSLQMLHS